MKESKYQWHDLRKNPDDLPKKDGYDETDYVLVAIGCPDWHTWEQAYYDYGKRMWSTYDQNVFAWKYVEPFPDDMWN